MPLSSFVTVRIDLGRIRGNVAEIARRVGVGVIAVVKADGYGLGGRRVAEAVADLVSGFYVFDAAEAVECELHARTGKRTICLLGESKDAGDYLAQGIQPAVWDTERATGLKKARPVLCVDTGQQRFACPVERLDEVLRAGEIGEAFTHASSMAQARAFGEMTDGRGLLRHAAGSSLLDEPAARFDAVRPGMAMYRGAARVSARLIEARDGKGPAGYSGFAVARHGVIRCGYSNGLRVGPCVVTAVRRRVLEVGMQTAFIEIGSGDRVGDEVVLLGEGLSENEVAGAWECTAQEALFRLCSAGVREYSA